MVKPIWKQIKDVEGWLWVAYETRLRMSESARLDLDILIRHEEWHLEDLKKAKEVEDEKAREPQLD